MKVKYYPETDTLYVELKETPSVESEEIAEGIVIDYDGSGEIIGIEVERISEKRSIEIPVVGKLLLSTV